MHRQFSTLHSWFPSRRRKLPRPILTRRRSYLISCSLFFRNNERSELRQRLVQHICVLSRRWRNTIEVGPGRVPLLTMEVEWNSSSVPGPQRLPELDIIIVARVWFETSSCGGMSGIWFGVIRAVSPIPRNRAQWIIGCSRKQRSVLVRRSDGSIGEVTGDFEPFPAERSPCHLFGPSELSPHLYIDNSVFCGTLHVVGLGPS
jgi:hypothetical protein